MKISKLIHELTEMQSRLGDVEVVMHATLLNADDVTPNYDAFTSTVETIHKVRFKDNDAAQIFWQG